jgi:hypothetical protein
MVVSYLALLRSAVSATIISFISVELGRFCICSSLPRCAEYGGEPHATFVMKGYNDCIDFLFFNSPALRYRPGSLAATIRRAWLPSREFYVLCKVSFRAGAARAGSRDLHEELPAESRLSQRSHRHRLRA